MIADCECEKGRDTEHGLRTDALRAGKRKQPQLRGAASDEQV